MLANRVSRQSSMGMNMTSRRFFIGGLAGMFAAGPGRVSVPLVERA